MVRPGRDLLSGRVEVDECYLGGLEEGLPGRLNLKKALLVVAAQEDGPGIGRIRMRQILDASAKSLMPFVRDSVARGSVIHTDGWLGYLPLESQGYRHDVTFLQGKKKTPSELMPRVHRVISLLKRWRMGTHQGGSQPSAPRLLPGRVYVPIQSAEIKKPRQTLLPPRAASVGSRARSPDSDPSPRSQNQPETTICRGLVSEADTHQVEN